MLEPGLGLGWLLWLSATVGVRRYRVKVCDFGLARMLPKGASQHRGTEVRPFAATHSTRDYYARSLAPSFTASCTELPTC